MDADLDALSAIMADPEVVRYVGDGEPLDRAAVALWIRRSRENCAARGYGTWAVEEAETGRLIGWGGIVHPQPRSDPEIVYGLERAAWGRGLGGEVAAALVEEARTLGLPKVVATIDPENAPSRRILERLGFEVVEERFDEDGLPEVLLVLDL